MLLALHLAGCRFCFTRSASLSLLALLLRSRFLLCEAQKLLTITESVRMSVCATVNLSAICCVCVRLCVRQ